jgi:hypothetical protein
MPVSEYPEVRPRSLGEILDDGWRLGLANSPLLLTLSGLFLVPASVALLLLLTQAPATNPGRLVWPAVAALLLPLTGLGSAACQEAFHYWAEGEQPTLSECLLAAFRRGLGHTTAQLLTLMLPAGAAVWFLQADLATWARWLGAAVILLLGMPIWLSGLGRHAVLTAGQRNLWRAWRHSRRASSRHPAKATLIVASRVVLLVFAVLNLHLFWQFALWAAEALGGFDVALARLVCSLGNPAYAVALLALAWWLLSPYGEAVNYLFYVDARTRYEGLDLWYRVQDDFPLAGKRRAGTVAFVASVALLAAGTAQAGDRQGIVRQARQEIARISREVKEANPYPGGQRWQAPLEAVGRRLDPAGTANQGRFRWYYRSIADFASRDRAGALQTLDSISTRLAVIKDSLARPARAPDKGGGDKIPSREHIKGLVPPAPEETASDKTAQQKPPEPKDKAKDLKQDDDWLDKRPPRAGGAAVLGPVGLGGLANLLLVVFLALLVAVIALGIVLAVRAWLEHRRPGPARSGGLAEPGGLEALDEPNHQNVASLWRKSDELAQAGRFLDAVRTLYLAVLALLHQASLIRYERTRTNGEYADQLRPRAAVHAPFVRLTGLFEVKWYGERACREGDYANCRDHAEEIRMRSAELVG